MFLGNVQAAKRGRDWLAECRSDHDQVSGYGWSMLQSAMASSSPLRVSRTKDRRGSERKIVAVGDQMGLRGKKPRRNSEKSWTASCCTPSSARYPPVPYGPPRRTTLIRNMHADPFSRPSPPRARRSGRHHLGRLMGMRGAVLCRTYGFARSRRVASWRSLSDHADHVRVPNAAAREFNYGQSLGCRTMRRCGFAPRWHPHRDRRASSHSSSRSYQAGPHHAGAVADPLAL